MSNTGIAAQLHVSLSTAKSHVGRLLTKLDARDRAQLVIRHETMEASPAKGVRVRVLVTGAFGYVGHAVTHHLIRAGHDVVGLTHRQSVAWTGAGSVEVVHADLRDEATLSVLPTDLDGVCHLAGLTHVRESFDRPAEYRHVNVGGTVALLNVVANRRSRTGKAVAFVQASTAAVYGTPTVQPVSETAALKPISPYGASKLAADAAVEEHTRAGRIAGVSLRAFNIAGAVAGRGDTDQSRIIPKALSVAAGRFPSLTVNGDGSAVRDFVHVADLARAYVLALEHAVAGDYRAFNVGATSATVREIVDTAELVTGRSVPVRYQASQSEASELRADTRRIREDLGWTAKRSALTEIITDAWAAMEPSAI